MKFLLLLFKILLPLISKLELKYKVFYVFISTYMGRKIVNLLICSLYFVFLSKIFFGLKIRIYFYCEKYICYNTVYVLLYLELQNFDIICKSKKSQFCLLQFYDEIERKVTTRKVFSKNYSFYLFLRSLGFQESGNVQHFALN